MEVAGRGWWVGEHCRPFAIAGAGSRVIVDAIAIRLMAGRAVATVGALAAMMRGRFVRPTVLWEGWLSVAGAAARVDQARDDMGADGDGVGRSAILWGGGASWEGHECCRSRRRSCRARGRCGDGDSDSGGDGSERIRTMGWVEADVGWRGGVARANCARCPSSGFSAGTSSPCAGGRRHTQCVG